MSLPTLLWIWNGIAGFELCPESKMSYLLLRNGFARVRLFQLIEFVISTFKMLLKKSIPNMLGFGVFFPPTYKVNGAKSGALFLT